MSSTKRRKIDPETVSNASGRNSGSNNASNAAARRGGGGGNGNSGGPGSRGGHSAATASRAAAVAASSAMPAASSVNGNGNAGAGQAGNVPGQAYVPVLPLSALPVSALSKYALHYGLVPPEPLTVAQATFPTPALPLQLKLSDSYTVPSTRAIGGGGRDREGRRNRSPYVSSNNNARAASTSSSHPLPPNAVVKAAGGERSAEEQQQQSDADNHASTSKSLLQVNGDGSGSGSSSNATPNPTNAMMAKSRSSSQQGLPSDTTAAFAAYGLQQTPEWTDPGEADALELRGMNAFEGGEEQLKERLGSLARTHWDKLASVKEAETVVNFAYAIRMRSKILKSAPMV
ncbi:hypothetical protein P389DRAFT_166086 [Cystobasidium minutum MCA 4210]|uniref:uncharacterized protein n=1 Tax=Cystobasidium minutum MCA 4210 TaxID=1397322 RepID=UPI0034CDC556|eukprot:jgi/Rhomi1/166086/fgenesh1_kg.1_\